MMMTPALQNVDSMVRRFLVGAVRAIKLDLKFISAIGIVWALMMLHRPVLIPSSANG